MDFALMSCPYCGGTIVSSEEMVYECQSCGKRIYTERDSFRHFIRPGELEDLYNEALDALEDDNKTKARTIADELLESSDGNDFDAHFLSGIVYASMGEEGKASNDWRKGLEILTVYTNIDAYICLMSKSISEIMYEKEKEYLAFEPLKYIDKICETIYTSTGESCKSFFYFSILGNYRTLMGKLQIENDDTFKEYVPLLFKRIVEYHRNMPCLAHTIETYLRSMGYNPDTYEDDALDELHIYDLILRSLRHYLSDMSPEDVKSIMHSWDDESLKGNEERLDSIMPHDKGGVLGILLTRKNVGATEIPVEDSVDVYVRHCLRLDVQDSQEPEMVE